ALFEYANNDEPVRVGESLKQLIDRFRFLGEASPDLYAYLDRFPNDPPPTAEDCLYWLKEKFWMMNVLSLNHSTVIDRTGASGRMILDVSKQLYASHYYESSLSLTGYVEGPAGASYLFNLSRAGRHPAGRLQLDRAPAPEPSRPPSDGIPVQQSPTVARGGVTAAAPNGAGDGRRQVKPSLAGPRIVTEVPGPRSRALVAAEA